jgi:hypothetical protein
MNSWTVKAHHLLHHQATQLAQVLQDLEPEQLQTYRTTAGGDERKLRGIPAIGRGVQGCIPGTSPHAIR